MTTGWFDGATQSNGKKSGVGGVLKINEHSTINWTFNFGSGTNKRKELLGVWATLTLASRLHISKLQVFKDSKIVIN
jgi:ribonuclease HI